MNQTDAHKYIDAWLDTIKVGEDIPLFRTLIDGITLELIEGHVRRNDAFNKRLTEISDNVRTTFHQTDRPEGVLYLVYKRSAEQKIEPYYVGISQTIGKTGGLNTLFHTGDIRFGWRIGGNGHVGDLNEALFFARKTNYNNKPTKNKSPDWLEAFIRNPLEDRVLLRAPTFVHMEEWRPSTVSIVPSLGHISILTEEMLRIDLLRQAGRGDKLLNS